MPFNSGLVASTAHVSAEVWQRVACLPERVSSDQLLDVVIAYPLRLLGRWAPYVWTYLCASPYPRRHHYAASSYYGSDDYSDEDSDGDGASSSAITHYYRYYGSNSRNRVNCDGSSHSE